MFFAIFPGMKLPLKAAAKGPLVYASNHQSRKPALVVYKENKK